MALIKKAYFMTSTGATFGGGKRSQMQISVSQKAFPLIGTNERRHGSRSRRLLAYGKSTCANPRTWFLEISSDPMLLYAQEGEPRILNFSFTRLETDPSFLSSADEWILESFFCLFLAFPSYSRPFEGLVSACAALQRPANGKPGVPTGQGAWTLPTARWSPSPERAWPCPDATPCPVPGRWIHFKASTLGSTAGGLAGLRRSTFLNQWVTVGIGLTVGHPSFHLVSCPSEVWSRHRRRCSRSHLIEAHRSRGGLEEQEIICRLCPISKHPSSCRAGRDDCCRMQTRNRTAPFSRRSCGVGSGQSEEFMLGGLCFCWTRRLFWIRFYSVRTPCFTFFFFFFFASRLLLLHAHMAVSGSSPSSIKSCAILALRDSSQSFGSCSPPPSVSERHNIFGPVKGDGKRWLCGA